jgi:hypothetical protein
VIFTTPTTFFLVIFLAARRNRPGCPGRACATPPMEAFAAAPRAPPEREARPGDAALVAITLAQRAGSGDAWSRAPFPKPEPLPSHCCGNDAAKRRHLETLLEAPGAALVRGALRGVWARRRLGQKAKNTFCPRRRRHAQRRTQRRAADAGARRPAPRCWWTRWRLISPSSTARARRRRAGHPPPFLHPNPAPVRGRARCAPRCRRAAPLAAAPRRSGCPPRGPAVRRGRGLTRAPLSRRPAVSRMVEHCTGYDVMEILGKNWCAAAAGLPRAVCVAVSGSRARRAGADAPPRCSFVLRATARRANPRPYSLGARAAASCSSAAPTPRRGTRLWTAPPRPPSPSR